MISFSMFNIINNVLSNNIRTKSESDVLKILNNIASVYFQDIRYLHKSTNNTIFEVF